jgi:monooxygenase
VRPTSVVGSVCGDPEVMQHVDVLIVGAGLSGIGTAWHLQDEQPSRSFAILEAREASGGTWDLFRYPGIRSDSDLSTFAYAFRPWTGEKSIADGPDILRYIRDTAREAGIDQHIRFGHRVKSADWSSRQAQWTVLAERVGTGETVEFTCDWLFCAGGYYRYDQGYTPEFEGIERFGGQVVHPQHWPAELDFDGKRVVVIGSGATAVTLVPAMARSAGHVTMLQRSPSYVSPVPSRDKLGDRLRSTFGSRLGHDLTRRKNIAFQRAIYALSRKHPEYLKKRIRGLQEKMLPAGYDIDTHFSPSYNPWDQRLCAVPDGDLFRAIRKGAASVVTDRIASFDETGIVLESGAHLDADVVVTATGLQLLAFGGIDLHVDGQAVRLPMTLAYKGMMLSGVPNFAYAIGYTNSSWTLKVDLVAEHLCRILRHMDRTGASSCVAERPGTDAPTRPLLDFAAGYVQRSVHEFPKQGATQPWSLNMSYAADVKLLRRGPVTDRNLHFARRPAVERMVRTPVAA